MDRQETEPPPLPLASKRILVVEDQRSIRALLEAALRDAGAQVESTESGAAALQSAQARPPDIILLDLAMPGMDGWKVLETLKANPRTARVPVVIETSAEDLQSFDRARERGVAAFLSKPFRLSDVVETCRRVLMGARPLQGTPARGEEAPPAQIRDMQGRLLAIGRLLDFGPKGAQVDLEKPLTPTQQVNITFQGEGGLVTRGAEVRWVTSADGRFFHGLSLREE